MAGNSKNEKLIGGILPESKARDLLYKMVLTRTFEENAEEMYALGKVHGTMHLSIGQEAIAAGSSPALKKSDYLLNTHRGHGHFLMWGGDLNRMMAEFMGKEAGYCRGRGGSMHIADVESNNLGAQGIVAGNLPISVGVGLSIQMRKTDQVVLTLFGDGASNEGAFHESLNMAAIWDLPVIYLCENNQYAMSMAFERAFRIEQVSERAAAYGMVGLTIDGNDVIAVYKAVSEAAERARKGNGPTLIEAVTYRWRGHSKSDRQLYRTREEVKEWMEKDPIQRFAKVLGVNEAQMKEIQAQAKEDIRKAVEFAEASPEPDVSTILEGIYA
ncbi:MAG: thiamine pyrophosphate-dependent dehydrogenase E1 component subunit alpha [Anaerolineae bacterium]|jgi:pyruvate dehydrogenase E1 component alpha subunit|nr:thiamine pyrophosphate-dependent dehydrogenase E1 component subunit alpha [Anaerolineae bacterium]